MIPCCFVRGEKRSERKERKNPQTDTVRVNSDKAKTKGKCELAKKRTDERAKRQRKGDRTLHIAYRHLVEKLGISNELLNCERRNAADGSNITI